MPAKIPACLVGLKYQPTLASIVGCTEMDGGHAQTGGTAFKQMRNYLKFASKIDYGMFCLFPMADCRITISKTSMAWRNSDDQCFGSLHNLQEGTTIGKLVKDGWNSKSYPIANILSGGATDRIKKMISIGELPPLNSFVHAIAAASAGPGPYISLYVAAIACMSTESRESMISDGTLLTKIKGMIAEVVTEMGLPIITGYFPQINDTQVSLLCTAIGKKANEKYW